MILSDQELSLRNAKTVAAAGASAIQSGASEIDMSALLTVDSSAVAVMLTWQRQAQSANLALRFVGVPASLKSLVALYGLTEFFQMPESQVAERH